LKSVTIHHGDSREVIKGLADNSIDSVVCDPPYALVSIVKRFGGKNAAPAKSEGASGVYKRASAGFMGQAWDTGETAFDPEFWGAVWRVLKPGGHLIAASGTRTYHRLAVAIEDAGFEVRDMISWLYGSGFPKSHDVSKGIDRANGDERPVVGDSPFASRKVNGSAGVNSVGLSAAAGSKITSAASAAWEGWGTALKPACEPWVLARKPLEGTVAANVLVHGTGALNIDACRIAAPEGDREDYGVDGDEGAASGVVALGERARVAYTRPASGRWPANVLHDGSDEVVDAFPDGSGVSGRAGGGIERGLGYGGSEGRISPAKGFDDAGSAARFFYSAKADADDRLGSKHPTVKPIDLMRYLVRLVTPPGGVVLDPFAGSGSTGVAAMLEGFDSILIEREAEYVADIKRKVAYYRGEGRLAAQEKGKVGAEPAEALPLFADRSGEAA
jgi:site-specific DNA-methyltransferase (adenine-specific)